ncbi:hypothetical protein IH785_05670 [candidate division KSB1 bacterium]|nr:hypothetical protein [candidate division KSB1 bacterium]
MISLLNGIVAKKTPEEVVVDVGGVGYGVFVPSSTYYQLPEFGNSIQLHIYTYMKENSLELFGFISYEEKEVFKMLLSVSGIGPRASINILSHISPGDLIANISSAAFSAPFNSIRCQSEVCCSSASSGSSQFPAKKSSRDNSLAIAYSFKP